MLQEIREMRKRNVPNCVCKLKEEKNENTIEKTVLAIRIILPILYVLLLILMFTLGRTHAVLFENKKADDGSFKAFDSIEVSFNGQEPLELLRVIGIKYF